MANTLLTIKDVTREALAVLHEELQLAKHCVRKYQDRFGSRAGQIGTSVDVRKPPRYSVYSSAANGGSVDITGQLQDSYEDYVTIDASAASATGGRQIIPMSFSTQDLSLKINDFSKQFIRPAVSRLARQIDLDGFKMLKTSPMIRVARQGAASTTAIAFEDYTNMGAVLTTQLAPESDRKLFAGAFDHAAVVAGNKGLFQSSTEIAKQYEKGYMGTSAGFDWIDTQNMPNIAFSATHLQNAEVPGVVSATVGGGGAFTPAEGDNFIWVTGYTASRVIEAGCSLTIGATYAIDPETQLQQSYLYTGVVASKVTFGAVNTDPVKITFAGPFYTTATNPTVANVTHLPTVGATVVLVENATATALQSKSCKMVFGLHKDALALAVMALEVPGGVDMGASESFEGIGLRLVRQFNALTDQWVCRLETQYGWAQLRPELCVGTIGKVS